MRLSAPFRLAAPLALLALAGCVREDGFPSLAQRPAELNRSMEAPVRPALDVPSDPVLRARVAALRSEADEGERSFAAALGAAEAAVSRAGASGSESWVEAQQALSRLESTRTTTSRARAKASWRPTARISPPSMPRSPRWSGSPAISSKDGTACAAACPASTEVIPLPGAPRRGASPARHNGRRRAASSVCPAR